VDGDVLWRGGCDGKVLRFGAGNRHQHYHFLRTLNLSLGFGAIKTKLAAPFAVAIATSRPTPPKGAWSGPRFLRTLLIIKTLCGYAG
jgi:hypothetical protein